MKSPQGPPLHRNVSFHGELGMGRVGKEPRAPLFPKAISQVWRLRPGEAQRQAEVRGLWESSVIFMDILVQSEGPSHLHSNSSSATFLNEKLNLSVLQFP